MDEATCAVDGCERPSRARGWCHAHWVRWRKYGDVQAERPIRPRAANGLSGTTCQVEGCDDPFYARRCCKTHHSRIQRGESFEALEPIRRPIRRQGEPCTLRGCGGGVLARGLCQKHYWRLMRTGTTDLPPEPTTAELDAKREKRRAYEAAWKADEYRRNRDAVLSRRKVWLEKNVELMKLHHAKKRHKRRQLIASATVPFTVQQLQAKIDYWGRRCWLCAGPFEAIDHVKPVIKGGPHMLANLRPICRSCNSRKHSRWPLDLVLLKGA